MPQPLDLTFPDGSALKFTHAPGGAVMLEARGALGPTVTAIEIPPGEVETIRRWFGKSDAAARSERARPSFAPVK